METRLAGQDVGYDLTSEDTSDTASVPMLAPAAYLEDQNSNFAKNFENRDYQSYELEMLAKALKELDERSRYVLKRRWLDENKATLQELSDELKVSVERVRQIENASLKKVKELIIKANGGLDENGDEVIENKKVANKTKALTTKEKKPSTKNKLLPKKD